VLKIAAAAALLVLSSPAEPQDEASKGCFAGRREPLIAGGFSGSMDCSVGSSTFRLAGRPGDGHYAVYDYRYSFMPEHGAVMHGGQRVIVFKDADYVGQYGLNPPPYASVSVRDARLLIRTEDEFDEPPLDFSDGPPPRIFVGGNVLHLFR